MYEAKGERASHIYLMRARVADGELVEITDDETPSQPRSESERSSTSGRFGYLVDLVI